MEKNIEKNIVTLSKPYEFENQTYTQLDMTPLEDVAGEDIIKANRVLAGQGIAYPVPETSVDFAFLIAAQKLGIPVEFFMKLNGKDSMKIKNRVTNFLFVEG